MHLGSNFTAMPLENNPAYIKTVKNVEHLGNAVSWFLFTAGIKKPLTHCIGHGLGVYACCYMTQYLELVYVHRITALDPIKVAPGIVTRYSSTQLSLVSDENGIQRYKIAYNVVYIDIIHTSILGVAHSVGNYDFWPNGGKMQPGCDIGDVACSHARSYEYFIESLQKRKVFTTSNDCESLSKWERGECECTSECPHMGFFSYEYDLVENGDFYLKTNDRSPYSLSNLNVTY